MNPARRSWRRLRHATREKSRAAGLAALLALLTPVSAHSTQIKDCSFPPPSGTCCPQGTNWPDGTRYPASPDEETGTNLYRLDKPEPSKYATLALYEYCNVCNSTPMSSCPSTFCIPASLNFDQKIAAVALYVTSHMSWRNDVLNKNAFKASGYGAYDPGPPGDFPQPADLTLKISGTIINSAPNDDFQGDCEDFAILRAALLRASPICLGPGSIWDALDQAVTHEYNIVEYRHAYRIMDFGIIERWIQRHTWDSHRSYFGWNQDHGPRAWNAATNESLKGQTNNCATGASCQKPWGYLIYYKDTCNCP